MPKSILPSGDVISVVSNAPNGWFCPAFSGLVAQEYFLTGLDETAGNQYTPPIGAHVRLAVRNDTFWSSPQTRFETHVEDTNAARKTLKYCVLCFFVVHLRKRIGPRFAH